MTWTLFWDMHSGGGTKVAPWDKIYVEAPEDDARTFFQRRFDRDPDHVTCDCCGPDYAVSQEESLAQVSGYHRNLRCVETKRGPDGRYMNDDPNVRYLEEGEEPPEGYGICQISTIARRYHKPLTLEEYEAQPEVLIVRRDEVLSVLRMNKATEGGR